MCDAASPRTKLYRRWVDPRYMSLRLADVTAYLESRGWKLLPPDRWTFLCYQEPDGGQSADGSSLCQFVPDSEQYDDYGMRMFELITGLAELEQRQASAIIDDILGTSARNGAVDADRARPTTEAAPR